MQTLFSTPPSTENQSWHKLLKLKNPDRTAIWGRVSWEGHTWLCKRWCLRKVQSVNSCKLFKQTRRRWTPPPLLGICSTNRICLFIFTKVSTETRWQMKSPWWAHSSECTCTLNKYEFLNDSTYVLLSVIFGLEFILRRLHLKDILLHLHVKVFNHSQVTASLVFTQIKLLKLVWLTEFEQIKV